MKSILDSWIVYRTAEFIVKVLPKRIVLYLAEGIAEGAFFTFLRKNRAILMRNYSMIFHHRSKSELKWLALRTFRNFSKFIYEFIRIPAMNLKKVREDFVFEGLERIEEVLRRGKGAIIMTAHLGNWELGGIAFSLKGFPLTVVVLPHRSRRVTDFFDRRRSSKGLKVVQVGEAKRETLKALRRNECVAILGDRTFSGRGISFPFFGRPVQFPLGAFQLSARTGAPIIPTFNIRRRDGKFLLIFEPPIFFNQRTDKFQEDLRECLKRWTSILERYVRQYPDQWYLFDPLFQE